MIAITAMPLWVSAVALVGVLTALAMCGPFLVRRYVDLHRLRANNEVAGFKFATLGVLYAVLLAFAVIVVWQKFDDADGAVTREAGAATTIYRLAAGIGDAAGATLRADMTDYLRAAIRDDWPAMARGMASPAANRALDKIYADLLTYTPADARGGAALADILRQLDGVTTARRERLALASGIVPGVMWLVLFGGALVTVGFTFFFGTENLRAQTLMTGALSLLIFSGLFIIVAIDHPFTGAVSVEPAPLAGVLRDFAR
ncbi:MAG TPA: DUF4239 domain-containing protein [Stellaceae bacterium]|jgi:hypothetical protein